MEFTFSSKSKTELLVKQALDNLGVDLSELTERSAVIAAIKEAGGSFGAGAESLPDKADEAAAKTTAKDPSFVTINIQHSGEDSEDDFVQIGLNAVMYQIKKGVDVKVPYGVFSVLNDAVEIQYRKGEKDDNGMAQMLPFRKKRHAFSVVERHYD